MSIERIYHASELREPCRDRRENEPTDPPDREFSVAQQAFIDRANAEADPDVDPTL